MAKRGRPSRYTDEIAAEILRRLSLGESLSSICSEEGMPAASTVSEWNTDDRPEGFSERYARARRECIFARLDKAHDDLSSAEGKIYLDESGNRRVDSGAVQLARAYADLIKWEASKMIPEYGDKVNLEHTGNLPLPEFYIELVGPEKSTEADE